jgi:peptidyl-prolyl cis-trans isomerase D
MISWIQQNFQQHFRAVFGIILAITIISFVFVIGATPGIHEGDKKARKREFFGVNLASEKEGEKISRRSQISGILNQQQQDPLARIAQLALADKLHIPDATDAEIEQHVKTLPAFSRSGQFDVNAYRDFREKYLKMLRTNEEEVREVLSEDIRIARVEKLLGGPGYVLPAEIKRRLESADTTWTLSIATVDEASFNPSIKPTEAELTEFFEKGGYDIPPQVRVSYADFPATAFVNAVTVSEPDVRAYYDSNRARFPNPTAAVPPVPKPGQPPTPAPASNPEVDYAVVRPQVEMALKLERAKDLATKAAAELTVALDRKGLSNSSPEVEAFLNGRNVKLKDAPAFSRDELPPMFKSNPEVATEAFKLNQARFFSDAIPLDQGAVVLFWRESIESRKPAFAEVRQKVTADYVANEKRKRFVELGRTLQTQLSTRLKAGEPFDKAVAAIASAANVKIEAKSLPPFTRRQRPQDLDPSIDYRLESLNAGDVTEMMVSNDNKGRLVYAQAKKAPDATEANPQYVATYKQFSEGVSQLTARELLQEMVQGELTKSAPPVR